MLYSKGLSFSQFTNLAAAFLDLSSKILDLFFLISSCYEKQLPGLAQSSASSSTEELDILLNGEVRIPVL